MLCAMWLDPAFPVLGFAKAVWAPEGRADSSALPSEASPVVLYTEEEEAETEEPFCL